LEDEEFALRSLSEINNQQSSLINQFAFAAGKTKPVAIRRAKIHPAAFLYPLLKP
jgi:hypothetical protein